jgi:3-methyl-2-oxobutanoate hydroxymethyltransferase
VKQYADVHAVVKDALERYVDEVRSGAFPEEQHTYSMPGDELAAFQAFALELRS